MTGRGNSFQGELRHSIQQISFNLGSIEKPPYAWQIKVVDQFRILTAITTVLEKRIAKSPHKGCTGVVPINLYCVTVVLAFTDGVITCVKQKPSARIFKDASRLS